MTVIQILESLSRNIELLIAMISLAATLAPPLFVIYLAIRLRGRLTGDQIVEIVVRNFLK